jgi:hypothetical protein
MIAMEATCKKTIVFVGRNIFWDISIFNLALPGFEIPTIFLLHTPFKMCNRDDATDAISEPNLKD